MPIDEDSPSTDAPVREARSTVVEQLVAVAADGRPTVGWSVTDGGTSWSGGVPEDCNGPSPAAVTAGVFACGYTARGSNACWPGPAAGTMVCLQDLWARSLFALQGYRPGTTTGPADAPAPIGLELENGLRCSLRKGGSWPSQDSDPSLAGAYSCTDGGPAGGDLTAVWVGPDAPAIDRSTAYWTARVGGTAGPLETVGVATAYFVAAE